MLLSAAALLDLDAVFLHFIHRIAYKQLDLPAATAQTWEKFSALITGHAAQPASGQASPICWMHKTRANPGVQTRAQHKRKYRLPDAAGKRKTDVGKEEVPAASCRGRP
jgi:hypothetical protein